MTRTAKTFLIWALVASGIAVWGLVDALTSRARADAALSAYETSAPLFAAALAASDEQIEGLEAQATAAVTVATAAEASARAAQARADSIAHAQASLEAEFAATLSDAQRVLFQQLTAGWAAERDAFRAAVDSLSASTVQLRTALAAKDAALEERAEQLTRYELRLAEAVAGWEAAERARRPGPLAWITRGLALIGGVVIVDRGLCAVTSAERILLPCS